MNYAKTVSLGPALAPNSNQNTVQKGFADSRPADARSSDDAAWMDHLESLGAADSYRNQLRVAIAPIVDELQSVESMIRRELRSGNSQVSEMLDYVADLGGKRLRPCLLLLAAKASGQATEESIRLAVVVELVHTATLVHDDVLDNAFMRRHKQSVHQKWSVPASVLVGDWLFAHAYGLANRGSSTIPGRWIADAAKLVCEGEIMQGKSVNRFEISPAEYLAVLDGKTGALCAVSCALGAWSGGGDETACFRMQQYGLKLGTAFQVFDDWLDVWGEESDAGKTLGTDLQSFKPTLPSIRTLAQQSQEKRADLISRLNEGDRSALVELRIAMDQCDASNFTKQFAKNLVAEAVQCLDGLPSNDVVEALRRLAVVAIARKA
jgi:octaprenyl-diphosphate synthase